MGAGASFTFKKDCTIEPCKLKGEACPKKFLQYF